MTLPLEQIRAELRAGQYLGASPVVAALIDVAEAAQRVVRVMGHQSNPERDGGGRPLVDAVRYLSAVIDGAFPQ